MTEATIPGYTYGAAPRAPISLEELRQIEEAALFGEEDRAALRQSYDILKDQIEEILDVWYGFVGAHPYLLACFTDEMTGQADTAYLAAVRRRFGRWILDTAAATYDQAWLDYQIEIGRRHHRTAKNQTDSARAAPISPYRFLPALISPITWTLRPFLAKKGHTPEQVERMYQAWLKSLIIQITLWSYPYIKEGDF
ncbi:MAG: hypothetical protein KatS3mg061_2309 [Dehalococcoidia bacterium]|nr:MAG: hypothetical protein KatS3mg061_2309 [Dehalococcoidia bacterium]